MQKKEKWRKKEQNIKRPNVCYALQKNARLRQKGMVVRGDPLREKRERDPC